MYLDSSHEPLDPFVTVVAKTMLKHQCKHNSVSMATASYPMTVRDRIGIKVPEILTWQTCGRNCDQP